jgi:hypothetical protein
MKIVLISLFLTMAIQGTAQVYDVGVVSSNNYMSKVTGILTFTDSTYITRFNNQEAVKKISNRSGVNVVYVTDGTSTDKIVISPMPGKVKGFTYDHTILLDQDAKFAGATQVIFFCRLRN